MCGWFSITQPHGQARAGFGGFISISGWLMPLCKERIVTGASPHISAAPNGVWYYRLGVLVGVGVL